MDDTLKTYSLICPDIDCAKKFDIEFSRAALDGGETIECPECGGEWEWEYDLDTGTLELTVRAERKVTEFHVTALVNPPGPQSKVSRHPNSIIVKLAEQLRTKGVL